MDPVLNSLVQSPFVRTVSTVPTKATSFVHGLRDNVPPFSYQKVVVKPWNAISDTTQEQNHRFRIPQYGNLNRAYLRIAMKNVEPVAADTKLTEADYGSTGVSLGTYNEPDLFDPAQKNPITSETAFDNLRSKIRLPWTHNTQLSSVPTKRSVLGGGGGIALNLPNIRDPSRAGLAPSQLDDSSFAASHSTVDPRDLQGNSSNAWNVVNILDKIQLMTNEKVIETLYGETIPSEVAKMPEQLRDFYIKGMIGYARGDPLTGAHLSKPRYELAWDPSACHRDMYGRLSTAATSDVNENGTLHYLSGEQRVMNQMQHADFIVPVTLSSLKTLSKNYQTRFVEDLELDVKTKEIGRGFNLIGNTGSESRFHEVELVLIYHNWHDNIENSIRNSNFKRGIPASIYSSNWVLAAKSAKFLSGMETLSIPILSRNLVTEILIVGRQLSIGDMGGVSALKKLKSDYTTSLRGSFSYDMSFVGSGRTIWSAHNSEMTGPDAADYDLTERRLNGGDCGYGGYNRSKYTNIQAQGQFLGMNSSKTGGDRDLWNNGGQVTQCGVEYGFGDNMASLRFGFQTSDEYYTGGVALQTISDPTISITPTYTGDALHDWGAQEVEFNIYVKHANMIRIDSDTGAITRTLDV